MKPPARKKFNHFLPWTINDKENIFEKIQKRDKVLSLRPSLVKSRNYTEEVLDDMGVAGVKVEYGSQSSNQVVSVGDCPCLLGFGTLRDYKPQRRCGAQIL